MLTSMRKENDDVKCDFGLLFLLRYDRGCGIGNFEFKAESNKTR